MGSIFCWSGRGRIVLNTHSGLEQDGISSLRAGGSRGQNSVWCQALISSTEPSSSSVECIPLEVLNIWCNDKLFLVWDPYINYVSKDGAWALRSGCYGMGYFNSYFQIALLL